jgi:hypothetical protein
MIWHHTIPDPTSYYHVPQKTLRHTAAYPGDHARPPALGPQAVLHGDATSTATRTRQHSAAISRA